MSQDQVACDTGMSQSQATGGNVNEQPIAVVRVGETLRGKELEGLLRTPVKEQSESAVGSWFQNLFSAGSSLAAFFAGFTLSIVSSTANSDNAGDSDAASRVKAARDATAGRFAAISSLLFVVTVLVCCACGLVFAFKKKDIEDKMQADDGKTLGKFTWPQLGISILSLVYISGAEPFKSKMSRLGKALSSHSVRAVRDIWEGFEFHSYSTRMHISFMIPTTGRERRLTLTLARFCSFLF